MSEIDRLRQCEQPTDTAEHENRSVELDAATEHERSILMANAVAEQGHSVSAADDAETARSVITKLDFILLPFLCSLFLLNSLDKSNIGNAETAGFSTDTGLEKNDLNVAMAFFFAFFVALQPASAMLGRYFGMSRWVPSCMALWGVCTILHVFVRSRTQLVLLRIAIAILESGFYPTTVHYLSLFYTRSEFAFRLGLFYGQSTIAGAFGGVLSWIVFSSYPRDATPPSQLHSWQLLFILEGCLTIGVAVLGFFWLPRQTASAWFFTDAERRLAVSRVVEDRRTNGPKYDKPSEIVPAEDREDGLTEDVYDRLLGEGQSTDDTEQPRQPDTTAFTLHDVTSAFFQVKIWHLLACNVLSAIPATAFAVFLPIVIKRMSPSTMSPALANLLAAPPFVCAAVTVLVATKWSDKIRKRLMPTLCGLVVLCCGLLLVVLLPDKWYLAHYLSICIVFGGSYIASPLTVAWISDNTPEIGKRAVLLGINGWGNIAGVTSAFLFTSRDAASGYVASFSVTLLCALASLGGYAVFYWRLHAEDQWREKRLRDWSPAQRWQESLHGDMDLQDQRLFTRLAAKLVCLRGQDYGRRGDDRVTYRYTF